LPLCTGPLIPPPLPMTWRWHDVFYDVGDVENCSVVLWYRAVIWHEEMSSCSAPRIWLT
jgi:hypothetical protein